MTERREKLFGRFTPLERRIIAAALARHARALEELYEVATANTGAANASPEARRWQSDAAMARILAASITAWDDPA